MKAKTRREIINLLDENTKYHNFYCCPDCRDILTLHSYTLMCDNDKCLNNDQFNLEGETKMIKVVFERTNANIDSDLLILSAKLKFTAKSHNRIITLAFEQSKDIIDYLRKNEITYSLKEIDI